ncbi:neo-calmodulin-like [Pecten maximus]|uniref:neo-calmodulin-like n=1 Tax=Pecten maximus TaxID=6579 RepID=UPI0014584277|nr:neo-calmodulin-like [Pecten maximus]XP_033727730.1 neo-calmodulin-like [Pecten maximus]
MADDDTSELRDSPTYGYTENPDAEAFENARDTFNLLDDDNDGKLTRDQFIMFIQGIGFNPDDKAEEVILKDADPDDNNSIAWADFETALTHRLPQVRMEEEKLREAFRVYDHDRDGTVTVDQLQTIVKADSRIKQDVIEKLRQSDRDGKIEINDLVNMLLA